MVVDRTSKYTTYKNIKAINGNFIVKLFIWRSKKIFFAGIILSAVRKSIFENLEFSKPNEVCD